MMCSAGSAESAVADNSSKRTIKHDPSGGKHVDGQQVDPQRCCRCVPREQLADARQLGDPLRRQLASCVHAEQHAYRTCDITTSAQRSATDSHQWLAPAKPSERLPGIMRLRVSGCQDRASSTMYAATSGSKITSEIRSRYADRHLGASMICKTRQRHLVFHKCDSRTFFACARAGCNWNLGPAIVLTQPSWRHELTSKHSGTQYRVLMTNSPSFDQAAAAADAIGCAWLLTCRSVR